MIWAVIGATWTIGSIGIGILIGKSIRLADRRSKRP